MMAWKNGGRGDRQQGSGARARAWTRAWAACGAGAILLAAACGDDDAGATGAGGAGAGSGSGAGGNATGSGGNTGAGGDIGFTTGSGSGSGSGGAGGSGGDCGGALPGVVRDFQASHPDFEYVVAEDYGIVQPQLGADGKPVYAGNPDTPTTTGQANFDQWFRDVAGVNQAIPIAVELVPMGGGVYTYDNPAFFPIDGQGFGDEGNAHNYHFTLEIHTEFEYKGGEVFTFRGDDDLFTFINGRLAMDLGGVHGALTASVDLDASAAELGITPGNKYALDFFFAERHTSESNFRIETTIDCFTPVDPPE